MSSPTPSCPAHDAITQLIRDNHAEHDAGRDALAPSSLHRLRARENALFDALAAVDGRRYAVVDATGSQRPLFVVLDRWTHDFAKPAGNHNTEADARADAEQRNAVNVAARAQELQDELDGTVR